MHIYEYLFAAFVVISILLASTLMLTITSEPLRVSAERENLKAIAQRILTQILLDPGDPIDWGSNASISEGNLKSFGLAYQRHEVSPKDAYVLDPDKISRLNKENPFYISPTKVRDLLGLSAEYGFTIEILPALDIEVNQTGNTYKVNVKSIHSVRPISDANVTAKVYYSGGLKELDPYKTGPDGAIDINVGSSIGDKYIIVLIFEYYNIVVPKIIGYNVDWAYLTGNMLCLNAFPSSNEVIEVIASLKDGLYKVENLLISANFVGQCPGGGYLYDVSVVEPGFIAALASASNSLIVATRMIGSTYGTVSLTSGSNPLGYVMEETVLIDGFSYIIRLYIWRLVW